LVPSLRFERFINIPEIERQKKQKPRIILYTLLDGADFNLELAVCAKYVRN
jgi:hypothetical protein